MHCPNCGKIYPSGSQHCPHCGFIIYQTNTTVKSVNRNSIAVPLIIAVSIIIGILGWAIIFGSLISDDESMRSTDSELQEFGNNLPITTPEPDTIQGLRDNYTVLNGDGTDVTTVMMYIIGSDLESDGGFASDDIVEMLAADIGDNINLVIMTGGATDWYLDEISSDRCQYWQIKNGELININDNLGQLNMTSHDVLSDFINYTTSEFPADRYSLIMWNHGGGTFSGFGVDENFPDSTLTLSTLATAFSDVDIKFDFVGFDACLMATAETAMMLEPYADYLIASQELEPHLGWYYTDWLTLLGRSPSISTEHLAVRIIDDYVERCEDEIPNPDATLSLIELRMMPVAYEALNNFFQNAALEVSNNEFLSLSNARSNTKDFGEGDFEQIDIINYIENTDIEGGSEAATAVNHAVVYYKNSDDVSDAHGLAMYFPYYYPEYYTDMRRMLHHLGFGSQSTDFFNIFVSAMSGGQSYAIDDEEGFEYHNEVWYDPEAAAMYDQEAGDEFLFGLPIDEKDDGFVLRLTDEQWERISSIALQVFLDDGDGYIDLGRDNVYEFDVDGDLKIEFDYGWVALGGNVVPYYVEKEQYDIVEWYTYGRVPAILNSDEYIEVIIYWDYEQPNGYVAGYRKYNETGEPVGKGLFDLEPGDTLEWIVDYYSYDYDLIDSYGYNDIYTVPSGKIPVSYEDVGTLDAFVYFELTDYYNNIYETEAIIYTD